MNDIQVSVIVPAYNCETAIERCLRSLVNQTIPSLEIICIDDGSTDGTRSVIASLQMRYPEKIRLIEGKHQGVFAARMLGIEAAHGECIGFCDADDYVLSTMYETMYTQMQSEGADMAVCAYHRLTGDTSKVEMNRFGNATYQIKEHMDMLPLINTAIWNKLIRRDLALVHTGFSKNPRVAEDMMYLLHVYAKAEQITFIDKPLYEYVTGEGTAMTYVLETEMQDIMLAMEKTRDNVLGKVQNHEEWRNVMALFTIVHLGTSLPLRLEAKNITDFGRKGKQIKKWMTAEFPEWEKNIYIKSHNLQKVRLLVALEKGNLLSVILYVYRKLSTKLGMIGW